MSDRKANVYLAPNVVPHVEAARRLLRELDRHAAANAATLSAGTGIQFLTAVQERHALFQELSRACAALAHERVISASESRGRPSGGASVIFAELADAVNAAEASHQALVARARKERDRLAMSAGREDESEASTRHAAPSATHRRKPLSRSA